MLYNKARKQIKMPWNLCIYNDWQADLDVVKFFFIIQEASMEQWLSAGFQSGQINVAGSILRFSSHNWGIHHDLYYLIL